MVQKLVFIKLILIVFVTFTFQTIVGQEYKKKDNITRCFTR